MTSNQLTPLAIVSHFHSRLSGQLTRTLIVVALCGLALTTGCGSNADQPSKPVSAETTAAYDKHLAKANALFKQQKFDDALVEISNARKLDASRYEAPATEALILHAAGKTQEAKEAIKQAIKLAPEEKREKVHFIAGLISKQNGEDSRPASSVNSDTSTAKDSLPPEFVSFFKSKETHARELANKLNLAVAPEIWSFIHSAATNTPTAITNAFERLRKGAGQYEGSEHKAGISTPLFQIPLEIQLAAEACVDGDSRYAIAFGRWVVDSLPQASIYFGGTDPGRGLPTALSRSHAKGDSIFTITQNALASEHYLEYLRATYGDNIRIPTTKDSQQAFQEYLADAQKRFDHDRQFPSEPRQLKPGEDVRIVNSRVQASGQVAVMSINAILAENIFKANPDREFYVEESYPIGWMYPHLSPYGFIFKLNRIPVDNLSQKAVEQDRQFWLKQQKVLIGGWLTSETAVKDVCSFAHKVHQQKDFTGFTGEQRFIESSYTCKLYSKLRSSIGKLYVWRATRADDPEERLRMNNEAESAFSQAFAFSPVTPEAVFEWVNLLIRNGRWDDAIRVADTTRVLDSKNPQFVNLVRDIEKAKSSQRSQIQTVLDQVTGAESNNSK